MWVGACTCVFAMASSGSHAKPHSAWYIQDAPNRLDSSHVFHVEDVAVLLITCLSLSVNRYSSCMNQVRHGSAKLDMPGCIATAVSNSRSCCGLLNANHKLPTCSSLSYMADGSNHIIRHAKETSNGISRIGCCAQVPPTQQVQRVHGGYNLSMHEHTD